MAPESESKVPEPADIEISNSLASRRSGPERIDKKFLEFIKDWGGIATVLIAILYTFPFEVLDRIVHWREHAVLDARKVLSDVAALSGERVINTEKITDFTKRDFLESTYTTRIYNVMVTNKDTFAEAAPRLAPSEVYAIASNFTLIGYANYALPFYKIAIEKAGNDKLTLVAIQRELGWTLFAPTPSQSIKEAREAYLSALALASEKALRLDPSLYFVDLTEFSRWEYEQGDWKCGEDLKLKAESIYRSQTFINPRATGAYQTFETGLASLQKRADQPVAGCPFKIPG